MYTGKTKKFKDTIHGYIEIPNVIVEKIIDTQLFQRLRCVEQTSMRPLYPAARHDRFIHSLGVYWLGTQAFQYFRKNSEKVLLKNEKHPDEEWWNKQELLFSLACLLHDCAHAPFSHTMENFYVLDIQKFVQKEMDYPKDTEMLKLDYELLKKCDSLDEEFKADFILEQGAKRTLEGIGAPHEKMSSLCVITEYCVAIHEIARAMYKDLKTSFEISNEDLVFIVRMIIGCIYRNTKSEDEGKYKSLKNCIISMLNSNSIDVDGLDYIVRDAHMSGIDNYSIDYQRLLSSFTIIPIETYENYQTDELVRLTGIWLKDGYFEEIRLEQGTLAGKLTVENIDLNDEFSLLDEKKENNVVLSTRPTSIVKVELIKHATLLLKESCILDVQFKGTIKKASRVISDIHKNLLSRGRKEYILGFEKNSLSIIQGAVEARNNEYLWVYTHPKVLYSANYLQLELLRDGAEYLFDLYKRETKNSRKSKRVINEEDFILYILGFFTFLSNEECESYEALQKKGFRFFRTCDDDLNALFKRIYLESRGKNDAKLRKYEKDCIEFFTRNHRQALWKSFVEYDMFRKEYDGRQIILDLCKNAIPGTSLFSSNYGEPTEAEKKVFQAFGMEDVLIVKAGVKTKQLNPNDTFISFENQTLRLYDLFDKAILKEKLSKEFYYLFAKMSHRLNDSEIRNLIDELGKI